MTVLKGARSACAATCALALFSTGSALAVPYVADITVTYEGQQVGSGGFTFDPDEATVIPGLFGDPVREPLEEGKTVYGLVRDFSLSITLGGEVYGFGGPWRGYMGQETDGSTLGQVRDRTETFGQVTLGWWAWGAPREGLFFELFRPGPSTEGELMSLRAPGGYGYYQLDVDFASTPASAVPLPGAAALFLTGLGGLAALRRRITG